jgi:hypothetical protein
MGFVAASVVSALLMSWGAALGDQQAPIPAADEARPRKSLHPKQIEEARAHFANGMKRYDEGQFGPARDDLEKAYALAPSYKLLYNLGLVQRQLGDPARAIQTLEGYLAQGAWEIPDARVAEVTRILGELGALVGFAKVSSNVPGVQISVDDKFVGQTPVEEVVAVNPGQHRITGKLQGYISDSRVFTAAPGEVITFQLDLKPAPTELPYGQLVALGAGVCVIALVARRAVRGKAAAAVNEPKAG